MWYLWWFIIFEMVSFCVLFSVTLEIDILSRYKKEEYINIQKRMWRKIKFLYIYKKEMDKIIRWKMSFRSQSKNEELMFAQKWNSREKDPPCSIRRSIFDKYLLNLNFSKIKIIHVWAKEEQTNEGMKRITLYEERKETTRTIYLV